MSVYYTRLSLSYIRLTDWSRAECVETVRDVESAREMRWGEGLGLENWAGLMGYNFFVLGFIFFSILGLNYKDAGGKQFWHRDRLMSKKGWQTGIGCSWAFSLLSCDALPLFFFPKIFMLLILQDLSIISLQITKSTINLHFPINF